MELQTLKVNTRGGQGKGPARRTRQAGEVPAVIYGDKQDAVAIVIDLKTFDRVIHGAMGEHAIVQLEVADKPEISGPALIKEVQHDPVKAKILHADFMRIRLDERLETVVSVVLVGRAKGVIDGGVIDHQLHEIEIECLALDVPLHIEIDVSPLAIGDSIHVSDVTPPSGVSFVTDAARTIVAVHAPRVEVVAAPAEGEELKEPEKIGEEKKDEVKEEKEEKKEKK